MADAVVSEKQCSTCKEIKPRSSFYGSKDNRDGLSSQCRECKSLAYLARKGKPKADKPAPIDVQVFYSGPVIERESARQLGLDKYFTNRSCIAGHIAQRFVKGGCIICKAAQGERWRQENADRYKQWQQQYYQDNKDLMDARSAAWNRANKSSRNRYAAQWREKHPDRVRENKKKWKASNPDRVAVHEKAKNAKRRLFVKHVLASRMRGRIYDALRQRGTGKQGRSWREFVPYTEADLIARLKRTMPKGYCWDDLLNGRLHVDHIIPVSAFNFSSPDDIDFQKCWALTNLRLLPAKENCSKGAKLLKPFQPSFTGL